MAETTSSQKHLLLGNGFSIGLDKKFNYSSLFEQADLTEEEKRLFGNNNHDFEKTLLKLSNTIETLKVLELDTKAIISPIQLEIAAIKDKLIKALHSVHPLKLDDILEEKDIDRFIEKLDKFENIFLLNYDLVLYWILMEGIKRKPYDKYRWQDGFRGFPPKWPGKKELANFFYLHGAIFFRTLSPDEQEYHSELEKLKWDENDSILDKISELINSKSPPFYVCEGSSEEKLSHILHSSYLSFAFEKLKNIKGHLYLYGVSLDENDNHIWEIIGENKEIESLHISYFAQEHGQKEKIQAKATTLFKDLARSNKLMVFPAVAFERKNKGL